MVLAQSGTAEKAWSKKRYQDAADLYLIEHKADTANLFLLERLAQSNFHLGNMAEAEGWYSLLFVNKVPDADNALMFAQALAVNKKYELSKQWYTKYNELRPEDPRAKLFINAYSNMNAFYKDSLQWKIFYLSLNTEADEFGPAIMDSTLLFTSNRIGGVFLQKVSTQKREPFTDLYAVNRFGIQEIVAPQTSDTADVSRRRSLIEKSDAGADNRVLYRFNERFVDSESPFFAGNSETKNLSMLNSSLHDCNAAWNPKDSILVYTTSQTHRDTVNRKNGSKEIKSNLKLVWVKMENGKWKKNQEFPFNSTAYSTAQPSFSEDGNTLYFISDMQGGFGGSDIYFSVRRDSTWSEPINAGSSVNTKSNEVFPSVQKGNLFFSTAGLPGLGGLDIFRIVLGTSGVKGTPENIGYPVNSSSDDFGLIYDGNASSGYFCSNRLTSDDIYHFVK